MNENGALFSEMMKTLERYKHFLQQLRSDNSDLKLADDINLVDKKIEHWAANNLALDKFSKLLTNKGNRRKDITLTGSKLTSKSNELLSALKSTGERESQKSSSDNLNCSYCSLNFESITELRLHCQTDNHQKIIMSDEGEQIMNAIIKFMKSTFKCVFKNSR